MSKRTTVECKQGEHYRGDNIFWEWGKQADTDPADHGTNETERMRCYSSRRRCWRWDCKGSHQYVCFQTDKPYWRRHRSCSLVVSYRCFRSDKMKSYVYNIKVLKQVLGEAVCNDLLFLHATFTYALQDLIRCPGCSGLERSRGSSESSKEKRQWKTVQKHSLDQSKRRIWWEPMVLRQW